MCEIAAAISAGVTFSFAGEGQRRLRRGVIDIFDSSGESAGAIGVSACGVSNVNGGEIGN